MEEERIFSELDIKISLKEIAKEIKNLKNNKACGFDLILNEMIKTSQLYLLESLQKIFNAVLSTGVYPKIWAKGYIVPIFKNGSKDDPSNYRGITVGSYLGKLFGKIMNTRLEKFLSSRNIISLEQIGFCKEKRTSDHHFVLKTLIHNKTQKNYTCFIDLKKGFDTVNQNGLFYKLRKIGVSDLFYNVLKSMYKSTELSMRIDMENLSSNIGVRQGDMENLSSNIGVRQGDNTSPTLFKIFINDLVKVFNDSCEPVSLNCLKLNCLMYADDLVLMSETAE